MLNLGLGLDEELEGLVQKTTYPKSLANNVSNLCFRPLGFTFEEGKCLNSKALSFELAQQAKLLIEKVNRALESNCVPSFSFTQLYIEKLTDLAKIYGTICASLKTFPDRLLLDLIIDGCLAIQKCIAVRIFGRDQTNEDVLPDADQVDYLHGDAFSLLSIGLAIPEIDFTCIEQIG